MTEVYTVTVDNGTTEWCNSQGQLHRLGGLPAYEGANGDKAWYVRGQQHRDGGLPAYEGANGFKSWWVNGNRHRDNGLPAVERADGTKEWWVNGKPVTEQKAKAYGSHKEYTVAELEALLGQKIKIVK